MKSRNQILRELAKATQWAISANKPEEQEKADTIVYALSWALQSEQDINNIIDSPNK